MKVTLAPGSRDPLLRVLNRYRDPCVLIIHATLPSRDLLRGPDGKAKHITVQHPPWSATAIGAEEAEVMKDAAWETGRIESEGISYLVLGSGIPATTELE